MVEVPEANDRFGSFLAVGSAPETRHSKARVEPIGEKRDQTWRRLTVQSRTTSGPNQKKSYPPTSVRPILTHPHVLLPPMINADNLHEAEQEALGQLAQMDLSLAARLQALAMNAEAPKAVIEFARALPTMFDICST